MVMTRLTGVLGELPDGMVKVAFDIEDQAAAPLVEQLEQEGMDDASGFAGTDTAEDEDILSGIFERQADMLVRGQIGTVAELRQRPVDRPSHKRKAFLSPD